VLHGFIVKTDAQKVSMRYAEDRELAIKIWKAEKNKAVAHFWELHGHRLSYMRIAPIPFTSQNTYLRCDQCAPSQAYYYQTSPYKLLLCERCAKRLKSYRYRQWKRNQQWKQSSILYRASQRFLREQSEQTTG